MQRLKVSREGVILIKSFEGFRPRAIRRGDGRWVIGYGHTASAREGASVSAADAELLLQYDLIPVVKAVNDALTDPVNQHQFDALASFAFSVGVEKFQGSDVLNRFNAGAAVEAADALVLWPEPVLPEAALRRRAAERALFVADPALPMTLSDLLSAPLPPPTWEVMSPSPVEGAAHAATEATEISDAAAVPGALDAPAPLSDLIASEETPVAPDSAVIEVATTPACDETVAVEAPPASEEPVTTDAVDEPAPESAPTESLPETVAEDTVATTAAEEVDAPAETLVSDALPPSEAQTETQPEPQTGLSPAPGSEPADIAVEADAGAPPSDLSVALHRYSPYSASIVGPLLTTEMLDGDSLSVTPASAEVLAEAGADVPPLVPPAITSELTVTAPLPEGETLSLARANWKTEEKVTIAEDQAGLFEDHGLLAGSLGPVLRHEVVNEAPAAFNWGEAGAYLVMGGFGLASFGIAMAAFRLASQQGPNGNNTSMIGVILALIGVACVGVSAYNLYRRWGRTDEG